MKVARRSKSFRYLPAGLLALALLTGLMLQHNPSHAADEHSEAILTLRLYDAAGAPLVGRLRLAPASWSERVRLGEHDDLLRPVPKEGLVLGVPPGRYHAWISRGPEWSMAQLDLRLEAHTRVERTARLSHQVRLPDYAGSDLHVHTERSVDAHDRGGVDALALDAEGVAMAVATDHNLIGDLGPGIDSLAGAEITTWAPEVGHFNAFPLRQLPRFRDTSPQRLFRELHDDPEVFVQINHPRLDDHIAYFLLGGFDGERFSQPGFSLEADGLELWNGYDIGRLRQVRKLLAEFRRLTAAGHRLTATGGSDSHSARRHPPGYPRTYVRAANSAQLGRALKRGEAFVTNGPLLALQVEGKHPGERAQVAADGRVEVRLEVLAPDWMELEEVSLWADDQRVWSQRLARRSDGPLAGPTPLRFRKTLRVPVGQARSLSAVVDGGSGLELLLGRRDTEPFAFTNPVYLSAPASRDRPVAARGSAHQPRE
jgi:hypothetical protein